jgi:hypothetical protein
MADYSAAHNAPKFGFSVRGDHVFPEGTRDQNLRPNLSQITHMLPLIGRYGCHWIRSICAGKKPPIDQVEMCSV